MIEKELDLESGLTISIIEETIWPLMEAPDKYVFEQEARIGVIDSDEILGWIHFTVIDVSSCLEDEEPLSEVFDTDADLWNLYGAFYEEDGLNDDVRRALGGGARFLAPPGILYLQRAEVLPGYRGHDLGLRALQGVIERLRASVGCVVMRPYPLQFEQHPDDPPPGGKFTRAELGLDELQISKQRAFSKLKAHYRRLGFKRVRGTDYFVVDPVECRLAPQPGCG